MRLNVLHNHEMMSFELHNCLHLKKKRAQHSTLSRAPIYVQTFINLKFHDFNVHSQGRSALSLQDNTYIIIKIRDHNCPKF